VARHFPGEYEVVPNRIEFDAFRAPRLRPAAMAALARMCQSSTCSAPKGTRELAAPARE
jgi:hypothetical protein